MSALNQENLTYVCNGNEYTNTMFAVMKLVGSLDNMMENYQDGDFIDEGMVEEIEERLTRLNEAIVKIFNQVLDKSRLDEGE